MNEEKDSHWVEDKEKAMKSMIITLTIICLVIFMSFFVISKYNQNNYQLNETETRCIANQSRLFTQTGCIKCVEQKEMFGNNSKYLDSIDCADPNLLKNCSDNEILITPTWFVNGKRYEGFQSAKKLKEITNC